MCVYIYIPKYMNTACSIYIMWLVCLHFCQLYMLYNYYKLPTLTIFGYLGNHLFIISFIINLISY